MGILVAPTCIDGVRNEPAGFTPVRRRESTINIRHHHTDSEIEWTAQKCNRLLRALTSRVAVLKKDISRYQSNSTFKIQCLEAKVARTTKRHAAQTADTDWGQVRKRVKKTYSVRGGGRGGSSTATGSSREHTLVKEGRFLNPGEFAVPTPILSRARGFPSENYPIPIERICPEPIGEIDNPSRKRPKVKDGEKHFQLSEMMRGLKKKMPAGRYSTYEGIYNGLETLLRSTASGKSNSQLKGSRSLLSMCLIAVPHYIAQEEAVLDTQLMETGGRSAINNKDVSTEIYDDLEAFGSTGHGWKQLRLIIRSHGIQVIRDAIQAQLFDVEFCGIMIKLCIHMDAVAEGKDMLSSLLSTTNYTAPKTVLSRIADAVDNRPLLLLWETVEQRQCFSFQCRELSKLFSAGLVPLSWVATKELGTIWTGAIQASSSPSVNVDAVVLIETILSMLARPIYSGLQDRNLAKAELTLLEATMQTFSSLLTTLTSIIILSRETVGEGLLSVSMIPEYMHISGLLRGSLIQWKNSHEINSEGTLLIMANILAGTEGSGKAFTDADILLNHLQQSRKSMEDAAFKKDLANFVCSIARCCGRGELTAGFEHLERLHSILESIADTRHRNDASLLHRIMVDSAFAFAQETPDQRHFDYALTLEEKFHLLKTTLDQSSTPGNAEGKRLGYRWEEGIGEWVAATPAFASNGSKTLTFSSASGNDSECDTPFRPVVHPKLKRAVELSQPQSPIPSFPESDDGHNVYRSASEQSIFESEADDNNMDDEILANSPQPSCSSASGSTDDEMADDLEDSQVGSILSCITDSGESDELLDDGFASNESRYLSSRSRRNMCTRQYIERAPRLSRRVLRHSLQWQLFEADSDDELSFHSGVSSGAGGYLRDIINPGISRPERKTCVARETVGRRVDSSIVCDSEDELCI
jgi:hypothetical protein